MNYDIVWAVLKHRNLTDKTDFAVLMAIACHTDAQGTCYLGTETIAREARVGQRTAEGVVERLRAARYFTLKRGSGKGKKNHYQLHLQHGQPVEKLAKEAPNPAADAGYNADFEDGGTDDSPQPVRGIEDANPATDTPQPVRGNGSNPAAHDKPNPAAHDIPNDKYFNSLEVPSTHSAHARESETPQFSSTDEPPLNGKGDRRPFVIGSDDARYHTQHFKAVLDTCEMLPANLEIDPQFRAQVAGIAVTLSENFTAEQISNVKVLWPYPTAPTPRQLLREIGRIVNRKPISQKENQSNGTYPKQPTARSGGTGTQRPTGSRPTGRGLGAVSTFEPGVRSRRSPSGTDRDGTPGENP